MGANNYYQRAAEYCCLNKQYEFLRFIYDAHVPNGNDENFTKHFDWVKDRIEMYKQNNFNDLESKLCGLMDGLENIIKR